MKFYEYTDSDGDQVTVEDIEHGGMMVGVTDTTDRRTQVVLSDAEARKLYREMGRALGYAPQLDPIVRPLTEERVREIAKAQAQAVLADYDVPAIVNGIVRHRIAQANTPGA